jgi:hypothetical protein
MTNTMPRNLVADNRGAVMLTGLVMSCVLIGALWFIIGIGDTIVFRDTMQEAADHGAFSAAALNAKGMNFIALLNLVMIAATVIYLGLGILSDVTGAIHAVCMTIFFEDCGDACVLDWITDGWLGSCPTYDLWKGTFRVWKTYYRGYEIGMKAMWDAEQVASYLYPIMGTAAALKVGKQYQGNDPRYQASASMTGHGSINVLALSGGMVPGSAIRALPGGGGTGKTSMLPVQPKHREDICKKVVTVASNGVINLFGVGSSVNGGSFLGAALNMFQSTIGTILQKRYCNPESFPVPLLFTQDDPEEVLFPWPISGNGPGTDNEFWGTDGFYVVYGGAWNGSVWFQTWAMSLGGKLTDRSDSKVKIAAAKPTAATKYDKEESAMYLSQSEMYFDCNSEWSSVACNFKDNALFAIKWRARLKKLDAPQVVSGIIGAGLNSLENGPPGSLRSARDGITGVLGSVLANTFLGRQAVTAVLDMFQDKLNVWATSAGVSGVFDPTIQGVYH